MPNKHYIIFIFIILYFIALPVNYLFALCVQDSDCGTNGKCDIVKGICIAGTQAQQNKTGGTVTLTNPLTGEATTKDINVLIGQVINAVLGVVGSLALIMFIYGGFVWMLAAGNNERVQKGKNILVWATVGLVVIFSAYAIVLFVFQGLDVPGATTTTTP